ncbi:enoyl-CoA hydratase/isomerase family protein [Hoyosella sp. YIM 151337]|uniref:enoyl-CoA hydratase/isomerase family protein n=1 Tax=Hoyosella sp. YIM 151337 TaxID=2992742 RepID=UPI00223597A6|nr:enoyl-CoA hydratase/isomerase family protein [Hoyosella sp. YIM 151337]MCW4355202.1 enoyl-CoA hydratase/isomerase family protein [Hoyosella sp. YIM 151337]
MPSDDLLRTYADRVYRLTLNRPNRLNALSDDMLDGLTSALRDVPENAVAVLIAGEGRSFCSGHDLKQAAQDGPLNTRTARAVAERMQTAAIAMRSCRVPIITRVQGYAIGGGAEIALSGDIVLASDDAVFQFTEAAVGRVVTNGFTNLLPKTVGPVRAKQLLLLGRRTPAKEAYRFGLLTEVHSADKLDAAVEQVVEDLSSKSPWALSAAKMLIDRGLQDGFESSIALEIGAAIEAELGPDAESGAASFGS